MKKKYKLTEVVEMIVNMKHLTEEERMSMMLSNIETYGAINKSLSLACYVILFRYLLDGFFNWELSLRDIYGYNKEY